MKYLLITMLLGVGYSQCNESNWQDYYPNMQGCDLEGADLQGAYLYEADFSDTNCWGAFFVYANLEDNFWGSPNFEGANLTYSYFDENEDEYDDVSYDAGAESGDLNLDGSNNILDVVSLVNIILNP